MRRLFGPAAKRNGSAGRTVYPGLSFVPIDQQDNVRPAYIESNCTARVAVQYVHDYAYAIVLQTGGALLGAQSMYSNPIQSGRM